MNIEGVDVAMEQMEAASGVCNVSHPRGWGLMDGVGSMSSNCAGSKRSGEPCRATVESPQTYCWWHDPANAEQRSRSASKAAKVKVGELGEIKAKLRQLADNVLSGDVDRADASVVSQVLGVYLKAIAIELKVKEQEQIIERVEELEQILAQREETKRWG